jgi:hypothetical protein
MQPSSFSIGDKGIVLEPEWWSGTIEPRQDSRHAGVVSRCLVDRSGQVLGTSIPGSHCWGFSWRWHLWVSQGCERPLVFVRAEVDIAISKGCGAADPGLLASEYQSAVVLRLA